KLASAFSSLKWICAPCMEGTTRLANPPVKAPWPHTSTLIFWAAPLLLGPPLGLPLLHAAATRASTATAASPRSEAFRDKRPLLSSFGSFALGRSYHKPDSWRKPGPAVPRDCFVVRQAIAERLSRGGTAQPARTSSPSSSRSRISEPRAAWAASRLRRRWR